MRARNIGAATATALALVAARDLVQKKHALLRNFPVVGHARYLLETIGPELRQYIVTSNDEERPFSRDQRSWIYASAKEENNYFGFGTDNDVEHMQGHAYVKQRTFAGRAARSARPAGAVALGQGAGRTTRPREGVPSGERREHLGDELRIAVRRGRSRRSTRARRWPGTMHNTGEGGLSPYHRNGGELVLQIGTSYFGCRNEDGTLQHRQAQGRGRRRARQGDRDQALARVRSRGSAACCRVRR